MDPKRKLTAPELGMATRPSSSRFQVDRVNSMSQDDSEKPLIEQKAAYAAGEDEIEEETPTSDRENGTATSSEESKSRFEVEDANGVSPAQVANRNVHFSMGDTNVSSDSRDRSTTDTMQGTQGYTTHNVKSFRNVQTIEKVPHIDHYRNIMSIEGAIASRPTLAQLHEETPDEIHQMEMGDLNEELPQGVTGASILAESRLEAFPRPDPSSKPTVTKFGWIQGVLVRCVLNILGVMLFLRLTWMTGQAGILFSILIVLLSAVVTVITTVSMCAISTNGEIKGGGCYFMISRSLGAEFGGSIGLIVFFANSVGAAMYVVGFAETVRDLMKENKAMIIDGGMNDIRVIAVSTAFLLIAICLIGTAFESKMQMGLLVILILAVINYLVGTVIPPTEFKQSRGVVGYSGTVFVENLFPAFRGEGFFSVFAIFFPAATGIMAGANISGDLADPQKSIPKGTFLAILLTSLLYIVVVCMAGATILRDASGDITDIVAGNITAQQDVCRNGTECAYGLMNYFQTMELASGFGPIITAGIFAATLSSALASFVSAPKVFQAVCKDRLFPYIHVFGKGYGKNEEPRAAYGLTFAIALAMILIGDLNAIAPIISNFFLASYALINYAVFDATIAESPGFRPSFHYYNMWLSLFGAILCISVMFVISWWTALVTFAFVAALYIFLAHRKPDVNWGSSTQAHSYKSALNSMLKLSSTEEHVKNYRPQILVLTGNPAARPSLVDFAANITKDNSLLLCGHVIPYAPSDKVVLSMNKLSRQMAAWLDKRKVKAFYSPVANPVLRPGVRSLLQLAGLGKLRPNILLLGFKNNWRDCSVEQTKDYVGIIHDAFDSQIGCAVLRLQQGLDYSELMKEYNVGDAQNLKLPETKSEMERVASQHQFANSPNRTTEGSVGNSEKVPAAKKGGDENDSKTVSLGIPVKSDSVSSFADKFIDSARSTTEELDDDEMTLIATEKDPLVEAAKKVTSSIMKMIMHVQ